MNSFYLPILGLALLVHLHTWFGFAVLLRRNDLADIAWGLGFILVAGVSYFTLPHWQESPRALVIFLLIFAWGIRLATYLSKRVAQTEEDHRYKKMRQDWGDQWLLQSYLKVFVLQTTLLILMAAGPLMALRSSEKMSLNLVDGIILLIALGGLLIEAIADNQKFKFKSNPQNRGKITRVGLWKNSRHPNYFGEMIFWFSITAMIYPVLPSFWWAFLSPILLTFFLLKVSGVPLHHQNKTPEIEKYIAETHLLWPFSGKRGPTPK